jgi:hypothetical protein
MRPSMRNLLQPSVNVFRIIPAGGLTSNANLHSLGNGQVSERVYVIETFSSIGPTSNSIHLRESCCHETAYCP